jgi:glycosyltransferase involved in cell wall biosynthesis
MERKKVLIVTYYWPPSGGGGVQRWVKFVKYLRSFGWEPVVFVPEGGEYPILDESLQSEIPEGVQILKCPIWEPYKLYRIIARDKGKAVSAGFISEDKKKKKVGTIKKLSRWVRGNMFFPDARKYWIRPATKMILKHLKTESIDALITTGPPFSLHMIGERVQAKSGIKWFADFRDPWMNMDNQDAFQFTKKGLQRHIDGENRVLQKADTVATVSWYLSNLYQEQSGRKIEVLPNGFDTVDILNAKVDTSIPNDKFVIGHYGTFGGDRNNESLWNTLADIAKENPKFKDQLLIELVGPVDASILASIEALGLKENLVHISYLAHHLCISKMKRASMLLVVLNNNLNEEGRVTGKIFEYLATGNQIIGIGSKTSDCANVIHESNAGQMIDFEDQSHMRTFITDCYDKFDPNGTYTDIDLDESRARFTRENLTKSLAGMLDEMIKK